MATDATPETPAAAADWHYLFDGGNTNQWRGYNRPAFPEKGWRVEDGILLVEHTDGAETGGGGDIITKEKFGDFELELEFALTDTSNSGIFYLVQELPETPIWHSAPEYQLLDDETYQRNYPQLTAAQLTGANYDMHPQPANYSKPIGEWNVARILKRGNRVEHWLNGHQVVAYELHSPDWEERYANSKFADYGTYAAAAEGHLGLQDHGHLCRFRNIRVRVPGGEEE